MPRLRLPRSVIAKVANNIPEAIRAFEDLFNGLDEFDDKQETLVSGVNIKTINGTTILGPGNLSTAPTSIAWSIVTGTPTTLGGYGITDAQPLSAILSGTTASFTTSDETKLDGIEPGAQANVPTDLSYAAATRLLASSTGADVTLPIATSTDAGLAPASGGGTANFLRSDFTWAAPSGGGAGLSGLGVVTPGLGAYSHSETIAAVGVTPVSRIFLSLGAFTDDDENAIEFLDVSAMGATPGTNQITVNMAFASPTSGPIKLNWSAL